MLHSRGATDALLQLARNDGQDIWVLVHVEVQTQRDPDFPHRMFVYHTRIRDRYAKDVCSLAVLGDKSAGWRPSSYKYELWGSRVEFHFPTAKLLDLKPSLEQLEHSPNPVAILVAAHLHTLDTKPHSAARRHIKFRMLRRLHESGLDRAQIIAFFRLVDRVLTLSSPNRRLFWEELKAYEMEKHMPYITSVEEQGRKLGGAAELRKALHSLLSTRLGPVPEKVSAKLESIVDTEQLQSLVTTAASCPTFEEFERALES